MKQFQLKVTEDELKALINHHVNRLVTSNDVWGPNENTVHHFTTNTTERLHQLMKRLHKDTADIERDDTEQQQDNQIAAAASAVSGWPTSNVGNS